MTILRKEGERGKWQALSITENDLPSLVYLNDNEVKAVIPTPISEPYPFIVYSMKDESVSIDRDVDERPAPQGYRVIEISKDAL